MLQSLKRLHKIIMDFTHCYLLRVDMMKFCAPHATCLLWAVQARSVPFSEIIAWDSKATPVHRYFLGGMSSTTSRWSLNQQSLSGLKRMLEFGTGSFLRKISRHFLHSRHRYVHLTCHGLPQVDMQINDKSLRCNPSNYFFCIYPE